VPERQSHQQSATEYIVNRPWVDLEVAETRTVAQSNWWKTVVSSISIICSAANPSSDERFDHLEARRPPNPRDRIHADEYTLMLVYGYRVRRERWVDTIETSLLATTACDLGGWRH
jgi:hypothetical protein